jgi:AraC-like DNA-binding protein
MIYNFKVSNNRKIEEAAPNLYINPERHPTRLMACHDIFYLVEGQWAVLLEDEEIVLHTGDLAILPAGYHHKGHRLCKSGTRTLFIHFKCDKQDHEAIPSSKEGLKKNYFTVTSHTHDNCSIITYFRDIIRAYTTDFPHKELRCQLLLNLLLEELSDIYLQKNTKRDKQILNLFDTMINQGDKFFTINELAGMIHVSPKSLTARFRTETGQSVHKYQLNYKLDQVAVRLQTESFHSLKNLALNFGFYDEFHLSSSFKKKFGVSPREYIKTDYT